MHVRHRKAPWRVSFNFFAQVILPLSSAKCCNSAIIMKNVCISRVYYIHGLSCFLRKAEGTRDSYILDRGHPVDWNIPYSGQPEAVTIRASPPPAPSEPEGICHGQTDRFLLMLSMCWNSCFFSSYCLEHSMCSHRSVLLAWKLQGGQGEFRSKSNTAASHPLRTFRKRYLIWHLVPTAACPAVPHSLSHWPIQKWLLQNFRKARKRPSFCWVSLVAALLFTCAS